MNLSHLPALGGALIEVGAGCLFLHAAAMKTLRPAVARSALRVLGVPGTRWVLRGVVGVEVALGVALSTGWRVELAAGGAVVLLVGFTGALVLLRLRGYEGDCGCGGASTLLPIAPELRNALLVAALVAAAMVRPEVGGPLDEGVRSVVAALLLASITAASALVEVRRDRLLAEHWEV